MGAEVDKIIRRISRQLVITCCEYAVDKDRSSFYYCLPVDVYIEVLLCEVVLPKLGALGAIKDGLYCSAAGIVKEATTEYQKHHSANSKEPTAEKSLVAIISKYTEYLEEVIKLNMEL